MNKPTNLPSPAAAPVPAATRHSFSWVPVRSLAPRHRPRVLNHLLALAEMDRYLRFGYPASDEQIARYVEGIDFDRDEVFGVFNRRLKLLAMAHLAFLPAHAGAEFGVSVLKQARGRGFGARLFDQAALHARNRGVDTLIIHALSENTAMLRIARRAGAAVVRDGGDSEARLKLQPDDIASRIAQMVEQHAAEIDYGLKAGARGFDDIVALIADVKGGVGGTGNNASQ